MAKEIFEYLKTVNFVSTIEAEKVRDYLMEIYPTNKKFKFKICFHNPKGITAEEFFTKFSIKH